ncbi:response regulator, partial [Oscillatoriales cyanobacterium LEGE 11467]
MTKILIVEDNDSIRDSILEILEAEGYEAIGTQEGKLGYELAIAEVPDLILCDVTMPQLDGYEVLALIRQNPIATTIPFIFLTAKSAKGDFRLAMELGADDYLTKPFTRAELLGAIDAQLQKKAATHAYYIKEIEIKEEQLDYLMHYDSLTGLPNRLSLQEKFDRIGGGQTLDGEESPMIPMLYVSLDRFNQTIEAWG